MVAGCDEEKVDLAKLTMELGSFDGLRATMDKRWVNERFEKA